MAAEFALPASPPAQQSRGGTIAPMANRLYTRSGDDGTTGLFGGGRVAKDHPRVEAYGTIDELNAAIGLAIAEVGRARQREDASGKSAGLYELLLHIFADLQSRLFDCCVDIGYEALDTYGNADEARAPTWRLPKARNRRRRSCASASTR